MFCTKCGSELRERDNFCFHCGASTAPGASAPRPAPPLTRSVNDRMIAGVCAGFARYMGADIALIRILWVVLGLSGVGLIAYIVAWIVIPEENASSGAPARASN
ncbi:MAG TPA: PspC domain-containing protein [Bryobacteraceae bacterium]|nr:PspC domain-containing protein [Bryobacteraceae bacterium]